MTCTELEQFGLDWLYGELDAQTHAAVEAHASGCAQCRARLEGLQHTLLATRRALQGVLREPAPARVRSALHEAALQQTAVAATALLPRLRRWLAQPWLVPVLAGATALALVISKRFTAHPEDVQLQPPAQSAAPQSYVREAEKALPKDEAERAPAKRAFATPPPPASAAARTRGEESAPGAALDATDVNAEPTPRRDARAAVADKRAGAVARESSAYPKATAGVLARKRTLGDATQAAADASPPPSPSVAQSAPAEMLSAPEPAQSAPAAAGAQPRRALHAPAREPTLAQADGASTLEAHIERADRAYRERRWDAAATAYQQLLREYPTHRAAERWRLRLRHAHAAASANPAPRGPSR